MGAALKAKRPPMFYTTVEAEVDIDPEDLEAAGWVYVGEGEPGQPQQSVLTVLIREMHEGEHEGPMRWCQHTVCREAEYPR